jgi:exonuclease VII large subunit
MKHFLPNILHKKQLKLDKYHFSSSLLRKMIEIKQYKLDETYNRLYDKTTNFFISYINTIDRYFAKLSSIDYHKIVNQGFAVIRDRNGMVILSKVQMNQSDLLSIEVKDGKIEAIVK